MRFAIVATGVLWIASFSTAAHAQLQDNTNLPETPNVGKTPAPKPAPNAAPPRSDDTSESSSNDTRVDLAAPVNDLKEHPTGGVADDVMEFHEWNPLKAMKDVEVGDYYYREKNWKAAERRYREALQYKPRDAVATFKLAQTLEKSGKPEEARQRYEEYLKILPDGPDAAQARKGMERLSSKSKSQ